MILGTLFHMYLTSILGLRLLTCTIIEPGISGHIVKVVLPAQPSIVGGAAQ